MAATTPCATVMGPFRRPSITGIFGVRLLPSYDFQKGVRMSAVSALTPARMSIRQFARRDGCDEKLVRKAIRAGRLKLGDDGKMDAALVGTGWREMNRRAADTLRGHPAKVSAVSARKPATVRMIPAVNPDDRRLANYPKGMAEMAHCAAYHLAIELVPHLPQPLIAEIVESVAIEVQNEAAMTLNEEGIPINAQYQSWLEHPLFNAPALTPDEWADVASEAERAKALEAERGTTEAPAPDA